VLFDLAYLLIFAYVGLAVGTMIRLKGKMSMSILPLLGVFSPAVIIVALPLPLMKSFLCDKEDPLLMRTFNALLVPVFCLAFYPNVIDIIVDSFTTSTHSACNLTTMILQDDSTYEVIHNDKLNTPLEEAAGEQANDHARLSLGCLQDVAIVLEHIICLFKEKSIFASV
jgi:hypothetical protein